MSSTSVNFPSNLPLLHLKPLKPPEGILKICQEYQKNHNKKGIMNRVENQFQREDDFKKLYEEKCEELIAEICKCKDL